MLGIVVGLAAEARVARGLGGRVGIGGGTTAGAFDVARTLVAEGVTALVSFGLAGGLDPALPAGTLIVPSRVIDGQGHTWNTDPELNEKFRLSSREAAITLLAATAIIGLARDKQVLWRRWSATATDMESGAVAAVAQESGLPFTALRAICDPANLDLPPAALTALGSGGQIKAWPLLSSLARNPSQLPALVRLGGHATEARKALLARIKLMGQDQGGRPADTT